MAAGFQIPVIPLGEVVFKIGAELPLQSVSEVAKLGMMLLVTVTLSVIGLAHWFGFGVKM